MLDKGRSLRDAFADWWHSAKASTWLPLLGLFLFVAVTRWQLGWHWSDIAYWVGGMLVAVKLDWALARLKRVDEIDKRSRRYRGRVWTFELRWSTEFMRQRLLAVQTCPVPPALWRAGITSDLLYNLKLEEFENHIRVHRWLVHPDEGSHRTYEWWDQRKREFRKTMDFWSYSRGDASGTARLSATCKEDTKRKRWFIELALWFDYPREHRFYTPYEAVADGDVVFRVDLDPDRLDEQFGESVIVSGRHRPAGGVIPYPCDEATWEHKAGEGAAWEWSWHLRMQTFDDRGSDFSDI